MKKNTYIRLIFCLFFFLLLYVAGRSGVQQARRHLLLTYQSPHVYISADFLKMIAGEFKGIWADYMLLEIGSIVGAIQIRTQEDWTNISRTFEQSLVLDPYFQQTYIYVQGTFPWGSKRYDETIRLLDVSKQYRPWDWRPGYYMGFDYYYFLHDYAKASQEMLEAAKIKGAPALLASLGARFAQKTRQSEAAKLLLQQLLKDEEWSDSDRSALQKRLSALEGAQLLQKAVDQYQTIHHHYPPSLETLIQEKIISFMPSNPYADRYFYDPATGQVAFDQVK